MYYIAQDSGQRRQAYLRDSTILARQRADLLKDGKTDAAQLVNDAQSILAYQLWVVEKGRTELYFGGSTRVDGLLDFVMWKQHADKLNIALTHDDIRAEINQEALGQLSIDEDRSKAEAEVARYLPPDLATNLTLDDLFAALGDELKVYLAQKAILGYPAGARYYQYLGLNINQVPATATPAEFWKFYRDNRTTLRVDMLPIKVEDFLSKVGQPPPDAESELKDLFNRYKDVEPNPDRDEPGFREPRRVQIEYLSAKDTAPFFQTVAKNQVFPLKQYLLPGLAATPGNALSAVGLTTQVVAQYHQNRYDYRLPDWTEPSFALAFYRDVNKPEDLASAVGHALGASGTNGSPLGVALGYVGSVVARDKGKAQPFIDKEILARAGVGATLLLTVPSLSPLTAAVVWRNLDYDTRFLPLEAVRAEVLKEIHNKLAHDMVLETLKTVRKEVEKRKSKPEDARKYIAEMVLKYHLSQGETKRPRDRYDIGEDSGVKDLKDAYVLHTPGDTRGKNFSSIIFDPASVYVPQTWPREDNNNWATASEHFLYWKTEDKAAYTPSYEEARPKVVTAWRLQRARELARKEAERIQDLLRAHKGKGDGASLLREESAKHPGWGSVSSLGNIARLVTVNLARAGATQDYKAYEPDEKFNARSDFVDQLMRSLKAPGDTTIVWNQPETVYYVILLTDIAHPSEKEFSQVYALVPSERDSLWARMEQQHQAQHRQAILEQLRNEAGAQGGRWNVPDDVRKRLEGRDSDYTPEG
jgi:hypothetical protein